MTPYTDRLDYPIAVGDLVVCLDSTATEFGRVVKLIPLVERAVPAGHRPEWYREDRPHGARQSIQLDRKGRPLPSKLYRVMVQPVERGPDGTWAKHSYAPKIALTPTQALVVTSLSGG